MIELRTLGCAVVGRTGDGEADSPVLHGKRLALLCYLVLARPRGVHARETLLGLFWPDSSPERARRALNQAVYVLRRALGSSAVRTGPDHELSVPADLVSCDAVDFESALGAGRTDEALHLYGGTLLDGFSASDAPGFERWLEEERSRLRDAAVRAALQHADMLESRGEAVEAVFWTRRACAWAPENEQVLRELLERLDRAGDRTGAVREYEVFVARLATELDLEPDPETAELAAQLRSGRAASSVGRELHQIPAAGAQLPAAAPHGPVQQPTISNGHANSRPALSAPERTEDRRHRGLYAVALALLLLVLLPSGPSVSVVSVDGVSSVRPRVLVNSLQNTTGDRALDALGRLTADWIAEGLVQTALVEVIPATATLRTNRSLTSGADGAATAALAREYEAAFVIQGSIYRDSDSLAVAVQLRDSAGRVLRSVTGIGIRPGAPAAAMRELRERLIGRLATAIEPRLAGWSDAASQPPTFGAYQFYAEGLDAYLRMDFPAATRLFRRAAADDSSFSAPLVWAVRTHSNAGEYAAADSLARRLARRRDSLMPWDRAIFDYFHADLRGDQIGAYHAMARAVQISPGSEWVYHLGVAALYAGRAHEATDLLTSVDPERGWLAEWRPFWPVLLESFHQARNFDGELHQLARAEQVTGRSFGWARVRALAGLGRTADAVAALQPMLDQRGRTPASASLLIGLARELDAHGQAAAVAPLVVEGLQWFDNAPTAERARHARQHGILLYMAGRDSSARVLFEHLHQERESWETAGYLALIALRNGDTATAMRLDEWFASQTTPWFYGEDTVWRAGILAAAGREMDGFRLLQQAYDEGLAQTLWLHVHPVLVAFRGMAQFEARMDPGP